ncbi:MAG: DUF2202 domain-containing protein [Saprospiraceae bacterium]
MKKVALVLIIGLSLLSSCTKEQVVVLSDQEKSDLLFLREEEKLARDVYLFSLDKYSQFIFSNISDSEQSHMSSVLTLLNKYGIPDPVANSAVGVFSNGELQTLYDQLTAKSGTSLTMALEVGATIEDLDINDIDEFISHTSKADLLSTYSRLTCGSRNHLRSFVGQLGTYSPVYISQEEYETIISSSHEQCGN